MTKSRSSPRSIHPNLQMGLPSWPWFRYADVLVLILAPVQCVGRTLRASCAEKDSANGAAPLSLLLGSGGKTLRWKCH